MSPPTPTYRRALVMAGGGGRLGVHLGLHAAACEAGRAPDLVVGTCGGALVAALVHVEPDPARQLAWLAGPELHRFWAGVRPRAGQSAARALAAALRRLVDPRPAARVPDLAADALFEAPGPWPAFDPATASPDGPDVAILGARQSFDPAEAGRARAGRTLWQPTVFGSARALRAADGLPCAVGADAHAGSAVASRWVAEPAMPLADAVRIGMTDMVYLPPAEALGARWLGGAVDLMPVELAARLARETWIDAKDAIPHATLGAAWRAVLGLRARVRQREVDAAPVALRIDNRGLRRSLPRAALGRRLQRVDGRWVLGLRPCADADDYRRVIHAQFEEGRRRLRAALVSRP